MLQKPEQSVTENPSANLAAAASLAPRPLSVVCKKCRQKLKVRAELAGKKVKCPKCATVVPVPAIPVVAPEPPPEPEITAELDDATFVEPEPDEPRMSLLSKLTGVAGALLIILTVLASSIYANLAFWVTNPADFQYFPPFQKYNNGNQNRHLGAEYHEIAKSIVAGEGFSNPFKDKTGPTAWMPPILCYLTAALLYLCDNNRDAVMTVILFFQGCSLAATGLLVLLLARQTTRLWTVLIVAAFFTGLFCDFHMWFQVTHDCWIILLALDLVIAGYVWCNPLKSWPMTVGWGLYGGICAMINPMVALTWGVLTLALLGREITQAWGGPSYFTLLRERFWIRIGVVCVLAALTVSPWIIRNYIVFGRFIPIKSNAAYEFWQSQCLIPDGLLQPAAFASHPYGNPGKERRMYKEMGEMEFLDKKREMFNEAVSKDPVDFLDRVACRFMGATLWYIPFNRNEIRDRPVATWTNRVLHPLPFLALLVLASSAVWQRLSAAQWGVMGAYVLYLSPYIAISYYERYAIPLLAVKVLLVIWALDRILALVSLLVMWAFGMIRGLIQPARPAAATNGKIA